MTNLNVTKYNNEELYKIQLTKDINLGNYEELNNDCDGELPNNIINQNGEGVIAKGTILYNGTNPFYGSLLIDENDNTLDLYLEENDYIIIK